MSAVLEPRAAAAATGAAALTALWYTRCPVPTASGIAQHQRWLHGAFAREGITLNSIRDSQDRTVRESHFRHSLPGSFREGGNVPPLWARSRGQDTVVVAITWVDERQLVLVRPDSPIRSVADLRGQRLGVIRKEASELVDVGRAEGLRGLLNALRVSGVGRDEVQWVDVAGPEWSLGANGPRAEDRPHPAQQALWAGEVDAIFVKGAGSAIALDRGLRPIIDLNEQPDPLDRLSAGSPRPVTVDRQTLNDHPEAVARYLAVLLKTAEWAATHPHEVLQAVAAETSASEDVVRRAFGERLHQAFVPQLTPVYLEGLRRQKDWLLAEGFIPNDFDFDAWIDPAPLQQAQALLAGITLQSDR